MEPNCRIGVEELKNTLGFVRAQVVGHDMNYRHPYDPFFRKNGATFRRLLPPARTAGLHWSEQHQPALG
jgi:hypothetical protein